MINLDTVAKLTWLWGKNFFLETSDGNYVWSDPEYPVGDNTIYKFNGTYKDFCRETGVPFGRDKGTHTIRSYCGEDVKFVEKKKYYDLIK